MTAIEQLKAIYGAFPRHIAPRAAQKAIEKAAARLVKDKSQPDEQSARRYLWKMATAFARSPAGQKPPKGSGDFRPHPATWFNQDRFLDDPAEWQKPNGGSLNGRQQTGTKATRTVDAARAAIERIENRTRTRDVGSEETGGVQSGDFGGVRGRTIEGTI